MELAQSRSYLCSLTPAVLPARSPVPAAPQLLAALIEIQPEPLASAAPAATGPAQATAATPLATASATPPSNALQCSLDNLAAILFAQRACCVYMVAHWSVELLLRVEAEILSRHFFYNWLLLMSLASGHRYYWIRPAPRGGKREAG